MFVSAGQTLIPELYALYVSQTNIGDRNLYHAVYYLDMKLNSDL